MRIASQLLPRIYQLPTWSVPPTVRYQPRPDFDGKRLLYYRQGESSKVIGLLEGCLPWPWNGGFPRPAKRYVAGPRTGRQNSRVDVMRGQIPMIALLAGRIPSLKSQFSHGKFPQANPPSHVTNSEILTSRGWDWDSEAPLLTTCGLHLRLKLPPAYA